MDSIHVVVVGGGLGGIACALACRRCDPPIAVTVLERATELVPVGAGIQLPPNAARIMKSFGLLDKLQGDGQAVVVEEHVLRNYATGEIITRKPLGQRAREVYGANWM